MTITRVAIISTSSRLIDRVVFPIIHDRQIVGFVGRRRPDLSDARPGGPKYLNTGDTPLFPQGPTAVRRARTPALGAIPVILEGPMDAIAVTLAGRGRYIRVAPLGTSLTEEQALQLAASVLGQLSPSTPISPATSPPNATFGC